MCRALFIIVFVVFSSLSVSSQENEIGKEVKIISKYKTVLPEADKILYNPLINDTVLEKKNFSYFLKPKPVFSFFDLLEKKYPSYEGDKLRKYNGGFFSLGLGNYSRFIGEFAYNNYRAGKFNFGTYISSNSTSGTLNIESIDDNIGFVDQSFLLYGSKYNDNNSYGVSFSYDRDLYRFYGKSLPMRDNPKQRLNKYNLDLFYNAKSNDLFSYGTALKYCHLDEKLDGANEDYIDLDVDAKYKLGNVELCVNSEFTYISSNMQSDVSEFVLNPHLLFNLGIAKFDLGLGMLAELRDDSNFYIYPDANVSVDIFTDVLTIYCSLGGDANRTKYRDIVKENPYVMSKFKREDSFTTYSLGGGLSGVFENLFRYKVGVFKSHIRNMKFFSNINVVGNVVAFSKNFNLLYDDVNLLEFNAEFGVNISNSLSIDSKYAYYSYEMSQFDNPVNCPNFRLDIKSKYIFNDKLSFGGDLIILGKSYVSQMKFINDNFDDKNSMIFDFNLNGEYRFSKYFNTFLRFNNIFNKNYERWTAYPVMGFNIVAGFNISF